MEGCGGTVRCARSNVVIRMASIIACPPSSAHVFKRQPYSRVDFFINTIELCQQVLQTLKALVNCDHGVGLVAIPRLRELFHARIDCFKNYVCMIVPSQINSSTACYLIAISMKCHPVVPLNFSYSMSCWSSTER